MAEVEDENEVRVLVTGFGVICALPCSNQIKPDRGTAILGRQNQPSMGNRFTTAPNSQT